MSAISLEERIERLEAKNRELEHEVQRLWAVNEIQNVINKFEYKCEAGDWEGVASLFAQKASDVRSEVCDWGVYEGIEGIKRLYVKLHDMDTSEGKPGGYAPGIMMINTSTTQVIEVAKDGKTAKGLWISPGLETTPNAQGKMQAYWIWCKLAVDFIKEDGEWKIWHYHVYGLLNTPYEKSWAEGAPMSPLAGRAATLPDELKADRPSTHPCWWYSPTAVNDPVPAPPEPFETFDERTAY